MAHLGGDPLPLQKGDILAGKYCIERTLGLGGMGAVFAANHLILGKIVAVKVLLPSQMHQADAALRFLREGRAASQIQSEHVAKVLDVGTHGVGLPFLVMEFLEGEDLASRIQRLGPQPLHDVAAWVLQVCEVMEEAHAKGIVHRDIKPSNIFIARRPNGRELIKVLDFGISKVSEDLSDGFRTASRAILGSPFYMAPEQMRASGTVDGRADIWSLGCVIFEALTGRPPFLAEDLTVLVARVLHDVPPSAQEIRPDLPDEIEAILVKCLAKDRQDRFQKIRDLIQALAPFTGISSNMEDKPSSLELLPAPLQQTIAAPATPLDPLGNLLHFPSPSKRPVLLGLLVLLVTGVALLVGFFARPPGVAKPSLVATTLPSTPPSFQNISAAPALVVSAPSSLLVASSSPASSSPVASTTFVNSSHPSEHPVPVRKPSRQLDNSSTENKRLPLPTLLPQDRD